MMQKLEIKPKLKSLWEKINPKKLWGKLKEKIKKPGFKALAKKHNLKDLIQKIRISRDMGRGMAIGALCTLLVEGIVLLCLLPPKSKSAPAPVPEKEMVTIGRAEVIEETLPPIHTLKPNPYRPEDFAYVDGYMTCLTDPYVKGIDVSSHQKEIDWQQVSASGVEFAILRLGYRGYGKNGIIGKDDWFEYNYTQATANGVKVGVYFFSQALNVEEAMEEARFVLDELAGRHLDMPVVFDWEDTTPEGGRVMGMDAQTLTNSTIAFCQAVEEAGYTPMIYFNIKQSRELMEMERLVQYPFWLAMYSSQMTYEYQVDMWQYSDRGTVPGITGTVDMNLLLPSYDKYKENVWFS